MGIALRRSADAPYMHRVQYRPACEKLSNENDSAGECFWVALTDRRQYGDPADSEDQLNRSARNPVHLEFKCGLHSTGARSTLTIDSPMPQTTTQTIIEAAHSPAGPVKELSRVCRFCRHGGLDSKLLIRHLRAGTHRPTRLFSECPGSLLRCLRSGLIVVSTRREEVAGLSASVGSTSAG